MPGGSGRRPRVDRARVAAERDGDLHGLLLCSSATRWCSAEPLWICQCMPSVWSSKTCRRYLPTLRSRDGIAREHHRQRDVPPGVAASSGGWAAWPSDGRSVSTTSWQAPERTRLGPAGDVEQVAELPELVEERARHLDDRGALATRADSSSSRSTPSAVAMRSERSRTTLMRTGIVNPCTFSKSSAADLSPPGPFETRSVISAIRGRARPCAVTRRS